MTNLELLISFKHELICRFYEWDDVRVKRDRLIVYHNDGELTVFVGRNYSYTILEVKNDDYFTAI